MIIRKTIGAGRWFSADPLELRTDVERCIASSEHTEIKGRIIAAMAPHAGYLYSGMVAGQTFRALKDNAESCGAPEAVVVLGFSHASQFGGVALMDGDAVESPLGRVDLDRQAGDILEQAGRRIYYNYDPHDGEHSAENMIPFVQTALPDSKVVVGLIGDHDEQTLDDLVKALVELAETRTVAVVASTDLLHNEDYDLVSRTDAATLRLILSLDDQGLMAEWSYDHQICCGIIPVVTAIRFARAMGASEGNVLKYRNSGDDFPESRGNWVVGYGSVVFSAG